MDELWFTEHTNCWQLSTQNQKIIQAQQLLRIERQEPQHSRNTEIYSIEKATMQKEPSLKEISSINKDTGGLQKQSQMKMQSRF